MGRWWKTNACERASQWISLDLDGELSQLERAALARHLTACVRCRELAADVSSFTQLLRDAPLVELERRLVVEAPRMTRRRVARRAAVLVAFAGLTATAVFGGVALKSSPHVAPSALEFRSVHEQQRFAAIEARRFDPAADVVPVPPPVQPFFGRAVV